MSEHPDWKLEETDVPRYYRYLKDIETASGDDRSYQLILLLNGIQVMLVHDPDSEEAAASMTVGVGYLDDPGMAHLCEHMLFLRSDRMDEPEEKSFFTYIKTYGGSANAFTIASNTCYYFHIGKGYLNSAIQRFSRFFDHPYFEPTSISKELEIVDSEYRKNRKLDAHRLNQVSRLDALPEHPWCRFPTGNKESLTPKSTEDPNEEMNKRLQDWWKTHYDPRKMALAILGPQPLNELTKMACELFSKIGKGTYPLSDPQVPPPYLLFMDFPWKGASSEITFVRRITDNPTLQLSFCLPDLDASDVYETKPAVYVCYLISKEDGSDTLYSILKKEGWITRVIGSYNRSARGFSFLRIRASLTTKGFKNYKSVLEAIKNYLNSLPNYFGDPCMFEKFKTLQNLQIDQSQKESAKCHVNRISESLLYRWPKERVLNAPSKVWKHDKEALNKLLPFLDPQFARITLASRDFSPIDNLSDEWKTERWYHTKYQKKSIDRGHFEEAKGVLETTWLPKPIPTDSPQKSDGSHAENIEKNLWFLRDTTLPKGYIGVYLRRYESRSTAKHAAMTKLSASLLSDFLTKKFYDKLIAGNPYSFMYDDDGNLILQIGGYSEKMPGLFLQLLDNIRSYKGDDKSFSDFKEKFKRTLYNEQRKAPHSMARAIMDYCLRNLGWTAKEMEGEIDEINFHGLLEHLRETLMQPTVMTLLVVGNFQVEDAYDSYKKVKAVLRPNESNEPDDNITCSLPDQQDHAYIYKLIDPNADNAAPPMEDSAVEYYIQVRPDNDLDFTNVQARLLLLAHLIYPWFFKILRTDKQIGYLAYSVAWVQATAAGLVFRVQSCKPPLEIVQSIDDFLKEESSRFLDQKDFDGIKKALIDKLNAAPTNLDQKSVWEAHPLLTGADHEQREKNAEKIGELTKSEMKRFYEEYVLPKNYMQPSAESHRSSLLVIAVYKGQDMDALKKDLIDNGYIAIMSDEKDPPTFKEYLREKVPHPIL